MPEKDASTGSRSSLFPVGPVLQDVRMTLLNRLPADTVNFAPAPARPGIHLTDQTVIT